MKIKNILALSSAAVLLSACAADENFESLKRSDYAKPISFNVSESSRAVLADNATLQNYGFKVYANVKIVGTSSVTPLMDGVQVSYSPAAEAAAPGKWTYAPLMYWPAGDDKVLDFYAVHAYDDPNVESYIGWDKKPHARYTVNSDVLKQSDYIWAAPVLDVNKESKIGDTEKTYAQDGIPFKFEHPLSGFGVYLAKSNVTYVDGANTYANIKEALNALNPFVGAIYKSDYIHSFEVSGEFPLFADINPDATKVEDVWNFSMSKAAPVTYTLFANSAETAQENDKDFAIYRKSDGSYRPTVNGNVIVLPCGTVPVSVTINHVIECTNGDAYLITATTNKSIKFVASQWTRYDLKYNVAKYIPEMKKLDTKPSIGVKLDQTADGMHAKKQ